MPQLDLFTLTSQVFCLTISLLFIYVFLLRYVISSLDAYNRVKAKKLYSFRVQNYILSFLSITLKNSITEYINFMLEISLNISKIYYNKISTNIIDWYKNKIITRILTRPNKKRMLKILLKIKLMILLKKHIHNSKFSVKLKQRCIEIYNKKLFKFITDKEKNMKKRILYAELLREKNINKKNTNKNKK